MTPDDAAHQARFLARCAREHGASWPRQSSQRYAGEQLVKTAYSSYLVVDGRCIVVQRTDANGSSNLEEHDCLGLHLVGYLVRHDDADGLRWTMHGSPRPDAKAVFWRATQRGEGHFVVTSRLAHRVAPEGKAVAPLPAGPKKGPPPLPARKPAPPKNPWTVATPTGGVTLPAAARAQQPVRHAPPRAAKRAERVGNAPPPPPPRCMKRDSR